MRFVLVHGAWHGGWCWRDVRTLLEGEGHEVHAPTLAGCAERASMPAPITLMTMVEDLISVLSNGDLQDIVLVGHSFGGAVVTGVADQVRDRIRALVYLDGAIIDDGQTAFDALPSEARDERIRLSYEYDGGVFMPPPSGASFGLGPSERWAEERMTPHPLASYRSLLQLRNPIGNGLPVGYIICERPMYQTLADSRTYARGRAWRIESLPCAHDAMVLLPKDTAQVLIRLGRELRVGSTGVRS